MGTTYNRTHIVMVPGFAGFDALGQLEYYAGVTPVFDVWRRQTSDRRATIHYFDNLPTAGVRTRAKRLRSFLAKRIARGAFQAGDRLALVGHSTGGLDIRQLLIDLRQDPKHDAVDGTQAATGAVPPGAILDMLQRIVFLSVPQAGTNLADWVRSHPVERKLFITQVRHLVNAASNSSTVDRLETWVTDEDGGVHGRRCAARGSGHLEGARRTAAARRRAGRGGARVGRRPRAVAPAYPVGFQRDR